jgi:hypothetical protein
MGGGVKRKHSPLSDYSWATQYCDRAPRLAKQLLEAGVELTECMVIPAQD